MNGRVVVTGAGGFVGRHIVTALVQADWHVTALDVAFDAALQQVWAQHPTVEMLTADADRLPALPVDALIHAAAITRQPDAEYTPEANLRDNLVPTLALLEWASQQNVRRAIFISSDGIYNASPPGHIDEDQPALPFGTYAVAKAATEHMVTTLRGLHGRDVIVARLSGIYGTGESMRASRPRVSRVRQMIESACEEGVVTVNRHSGARSWTYAADIGAALVALLHTPTLNHAIYNVATEERLTEDDIAAALQALLPHMRIEYTDAPPPTRHGYLSHARLRADTGFEAWTPFQTGLAQVLADIRTPDLTPSSQERLRRGHV